MTADWPGMFAPERTILRTVFNAPWGLVFAEEPGCVYPSMRVGLAIAGRDAVGAIVQTPEPSQPVPETLNAIVSRPAAALASSSAWR